MGNQENLTPFEKGKSPGRPKGAKDKRWATIEYWFTELQKTLDHPDLSISDKAKAQLKCIELILAKRNLPNETAEESVNNAAEALKLMKELESEMDRKA